MPSFIQETRYGENILIAICVLGLLAAILSLFQDQYIRRVGLLSVFLFGISYVLVLSTLEVMDFELPKWLGSRRQGGYGGLFMVAWMFGSYKLADWLYYRLLP